jgi:hypothetical protein
MQNEKKFSLYIHPSKAFYCFDKLVSYKLLNYRDGNVSNSETLYSYNSEATNDIFWESNNIQYYLKDY